MHPMPWAIIAEEQIAHLAAQSAISRKRKTVWQCVNEIMPNSLEKLVKADHPPAQVNQRSKSGATPLELAIRLAVMPPSHYAEEYRHLSEMNIRLLAAASTTETLARALNYAGQLKGRYRIVSNGKNRQKNFSEVNAEQLKNVKSLLHAAMASHPSI